MPSFEVVLDGKDLELLGTDKQANIEQVLAMLAEVALGEAVEQVLLPQPDNQNNLG